MSGWRVLRAWKSASRIVQASAQVELGLFASFWERRDQNGVSFPEEEGPDPSGVRPWAFALDEGIVT